MKWLIKLLLFFSRSDEKTFFLKLKVFIIGPLITLLSISLYNRGVNNSLIPFCISFVFLNIVDEERKTIWKVIHPYFEIFNHWALRKIDEK